MQTESTTLRNVVIVSESDGHARVDRDTAKHLGAEFVVVFSTGHEAEVFIRKNPVDLVVCDLKLVDGEGHAFITRLREDAATSTVPVLMASLEHRELDVLKAMAAGCSAYLLRPYSIQGFERQVARAVSRGRLPEELSAWAARMRDEKALAEERRKQRVILSAIASQLLAMFMEAAPGDLDINPNVV